MHQIWKRVKTNHVSEALKGNGIDNNLKSDTPSGCFSL